MTGALLDRPCAPSASGGEGIDRGPVTLRELLDATIETARAKGGAECPVCHACMTPTPAGAACAGCGSRLS